MVGGGTEKGPNHGQELKKNPFPIFSVFNEAGDGALIEYAGWSLLHWKLSGVSWHLCREFSFHLVVIGVWMRHGCIMGKWVTRLAGKGLELQRRTGTDSNSCSPF